jgi:glycosyltransferase involved in cell wall biosynthesis
MRFGIGRSGRFTVISDGIELDRFINCRADKQAVRTELGVPDGAPLVGIVARLVAVKGHKYLLDAFKSVLRIFPEARLLIVGDGLLKKDLEKHSERIGIADRVIFTGLRYDIPRLLSVLDVATLPSLNEGLGIALLEAMLMKNPVVASNIGGMPEIVDDGVVGYLVPPRDSRALADKILKVIKDPEKARAMGEEGYKKIISNFSIENKIEELERLYVSLLDKKFVTARDKIKVLHVITRLIVGGAQENTLYTVAGLDKSKYWVVLASGPTDGPEGNIEDIVHKNKINFVKIPELVREIDLYKDLIAFFKLYRLIRRYRFDIVHTHTSKAGILGRCAAKMAGTQVIVHTPHGHLFYGYYGKFKTRSFIWLERTIARITSCIITLTEIGKKEHISFGIAQPQKFRVVQSGIDAEAFKKTDPSRVEKLRKELGLSSDNKVVGTVARLVPVKGHSYFIQAAEKIVKVIPQSRFMIVGDGVLRAKLEKLVKEKNLRDYFYFLGLRSDVSDLLSLFDVFVLSSLNEGMGKVVVEAMASSKPVVATRVGGIPEVVSDNDTGLLVEPMNIDSLAESVISLLKDKQRSMAMGEAGRRRAEAIFLKDEMVCKIDKIYREFLYKTCR